MNEMSPLRLEEIRRLLAETPPTAWSQIADELLAEVDRLTLLVMIKTEDFPGG